MHHEVSPRVADNADATPEKDVSPLDRALTASAAREAAERRTLRVAILVAALFHLVLLVATFPSLGAKPRELDTRPQQVFVVQQLRFEPPAARPQQEIPQRKAKRIPIPDPTPDDPEPIEIALPEPEIELPMADVAFFGIPDAPPEARAAFGAGEVFQVGAGITPPVKILAPQPKYTEDARQGRVEGTVILQAVVDAMGNVSQVTVLKGLPLGLSESAVETVREWRYQPAMRGSEPVAVYLSLLINFSLQ